MRVAKARLWSFAVFLAVAIVFARVFGVNAYATVGAVIGLAGCVWLVASFLLGVWRGWRG